MIHIFCGEDSTAARDAYREEIETREAQGAEIVYIQPSQVIELKQGLADNISLFSASKVFCVESLEKGGFRKSTKAKADSLYEAIVSISQDKTIILLDFEEGKQGRQLKMRDLAKVHESKPTMSIFKLLDECVPGNQIPFIQSLRFVCESQDEMFVFIMLYRHVRQLVLATEEGAVSKLPPWQKYKIIAQSKKWKKQSLIDFYSGLIKIEISSKSSSNPYGIAKSIEILACHYL